MMRRLNCGLVEFGIMGTRMLNAFDRRSRYWFGFAIVLGGGYCVAPGWAGGSGRASAGRGGRARGRASRRLQLLRRLGRDLCDVQ
jgi:hypothetical protein